MIIQENVKLSDILWYSIGGVTRFLITCNTKKDILDALEFINKNSIKRIFVCGYGTNLIFSDNFFDGAVIKITEDYSKQPEISLEGKNTVLAFSGTALDSVITYTLNHNLIGLEWAGGLPGTIGAAVRGNVGAYGGEIKDSLLEAEVLAKIDENTFEIKKISKQDLNFSYRHSLIKDNPGRMIVLSAAFRLKQATSEEIVKAREIYNLHIQQRKDRHPLEYPNCGSVFKNIREPEKIGKVLSVFPDLKERIDTSWYGKVASAHLIQRLGLQGLRIGDAQISKKHALFIVNRGHAKAKEVFGIINVIQSKFMEKFGFTLEPEVEIVN